MDGVERAGRLHVVYGDGTTQTVSQADAFVNGAPEAGDRFGFSLEATDWNGDGCSDLVVGAPFEALSTSAESGWVQVLWGSPTGLGTGEYENFYPNSSGFAGVDRAGDRFGYSLAAGETTDGEPYLVFGIPGRELDTSDGMLERAGAVAYTRGGARALTHQDSPGVFGIAEAGDLFGYSVAASGRYVAAGGLRRSRRFRDRLGNGGGAGPHDHPGRVARCGRNRPGRCR